MAHFCDFERQRPSLECGFLRILHPKDRFRHGDGDGRHSRLPVASTKALNMNVEYPTIDHNLLADFLKSAPASELAGITPDRIFASLMGVIVDLDLTHVFDEFVEWLRYFDEKKAAH
jgi:hypothetical protein